MSKYAVRLSDAERHRLESLCRKGRHHARTIRLIDAGHSYKQMSTMEGTGRTTPLELAKRFHERGLDRALYDAPRPGQARVLDDRDEAFLIALACSSPPDGYGCWTISLMNAEIRKRTRKTPSNSTLARILMANNLKPWREKNGVCA